MNAHGESNGAVRALLFVALTLLVWVVLAALSAAIVRVVYGVFTHDQDHVWFPVVRFDEWRWFFKAAFLGSTLAVALWAAFETLFSPVDDCKPSAS